jgi:GT2 family glycosyltransferase
VHSPPAVSILLVAWNASAVIERCLQSLDVDRHEVIVVDNASADGTADRVALTHPRVQLVRATTNLGFAGGVNAGLRLCRGEFVLLLNCDVTASPGAIDYLLYALRSRPDSAAAGGLLLGETGEPQHGFHVRRFPALATWAVELWLVDHVWPGNPVTRRYEARDLTSGATVPTEVDQPAAACLMVRRDVLRALGGLDERFHPAWFEDVDLCRRIRNAGWSILFVPAARFSHAGGVAARRLGLAAFSRIWYRNLQRYVRKHHGAATLIAVKALIVSGMMLRVCVTLARGRAGDASAYTRVALDAVTTWN